MRIREAGKRCAETAVSLMVGLGIFGFLLWSGIAATRADRPVLYIFITFYNLLFATARYLSTITLHFSPVLFLAGGLTFLSIGIVLLYKDLRENRGIALFFVSLGGGILSWGLLQGRYELTGLVVGLAAMIGMVIAATFPTLFSEIDSGGPARRDKIILYLILIFTLLNCFYRLKIHPYHLSGWEVSSGISVVQLWQGDHPEYGKLLWKALERPLNGAPTSPFFVYPLALLFKLFGTHFLVIRSAGVFWGLAYLLILYLLIKDLFGTRIALLTVFLTSVSAWFLSIARYGGYLSLSICYVLLVLLLFLRGIRKGELWYLVSAGGMLALFSYFYLPVKVIFPLMGLVWLHNFCFSRRSFPRKLLEASLLLAGFFLVSFILGNPFPKVGGVATPHIFMGSPPGEPGFSLTVALDDLKHNLGRLFYSFFYRSHGVEFPAPQGRLIERGILLLTILGWSWSLGRWKKIPYFFLALSAILPLLPVLIISSRMYDQPLARRCLIMSPFLAAAAAVTLDVVIRSLLLIKKPARRWAGGTICAFLVAAFMISGLNRYFNSPTHPYLGVKRGFVEHGLQLLDKGYYLEIAESDYHLRELFDFLAYSRTGRLYTYYPYMGEHYLHSGRVTDVTRYRPSGDNPYFNFWTVSGITEALRTAAGRHKAAVLFENEYPFEARSVLGEIISYDPRALIEPIRDDAGRVVGFQYLLPSDTGKSPSI